MNVSIEFYFENGVYGAYIGSDCGSGIDVKGNTPEELAENLKPYIADFANDVNSLSDDEDDM